MERFQLSHGQTQVRKQFRYKNLYWNWRALVNIVRSFNSDVIMVVNGQGITAFVNDCLCGIKAISQYVFKFCSWAALIPDQGSKIVHVRSYLRVEVR